MPVALAPIYEGGVRKNRDIHIPINLGLAPRQRIQTGYTAANSYLNPGLLVCHDRSCELEYETDHTGNLFFASYSRPVLEKFEFGVTAGSYSMDDVVAISPVHRLVSDGVLRDFHERILRDDSLPELSNAPDGRQRFSATDLAGRRLTLIPGHRYALPLRLDLTRYFDLKQTSRSRLALNTGVHLSHPLDGDPGPGPDQVALVRGIDFGFSANLVRSLRLTGNLSSTFHFHVARFRTNVHVVNPNSTSNGDDPTRSQYALTYGLRFAGTFGGRAPCSFAISQITNSAHYDKQTYWAWDPLVFEGGNNHRGALAGANDYGVVTFGCELRERLFQVGIAEDIGGFSQLVDDDGAGTSYDPDLAVSVTVAWNLGQRRSAD